ncbi:MAG TPA: gamma-glutamyl-gamma-aminobutyrate hydrolase family protein [Candidatus Dormibacteraeota bacterium]|nr:gamma-glutamyl-gamma-aminobutyrate hydrolase family protein [Candidatus Dormibacteraeota bacterium]
MKPFIAITAGEFINSGEKWLPVVHGQFHTYADAIVRAGGVPFIVPLTDDKSVLRSLYEQCDGLLLPGGSDLDPKAYNMPRSSNKVNAATHPLQTRVSPRRDQQEKQLLKWALEDDKPVLGICRGMQLINVALGGSLHSDININLPSAQNHEANIHKKDFHYLAHQLRINPGSRLAQALGTDTLATNSLHHQTIKKLGDGLVATAYTDDEVIEAIELPAGNFVIGVQSHPEALEAGAEPVWRELFNAFVIASKAGRKRSTIRAARSKR